MFRVFGHRMAVMAVVAGLALGACSTNTTPGGGGDAQQGGGGGGGGGGNGSASAIAACTLLTPDEIKQQIGSPVDDGLLQTTDSQASCDWNATDDSNKAVGIIVQDFDQSLWDALSSAGNATAVSGFGEAAFKGEPAPGDLSIKQGSYEIDVAVIDFSVSNDDAQKEAQALAGLVLPRVP